MQLVTSTSPAPVKRTLIAAAFLLLAVFHFAPQAAAAPALSQLIEAAPAVEIPYAPPPDNATVYTPAPGLNVYFLSVGQGDAVYIELPGGRNALIDGGPSRTSSSPLAKFLAEKNITAIDHVVLTHPHSDHYNGLQYVFSTMTVRNFYDTRVDNKGATGDDAVRAKVADLGINTVYPSPGDNLDWSAPGVEIKVFNACNKAFASSNSETLNNCSIMFKLTYRGSSILFTGDTEGETEAMLAGKYGEKLKADVLKVGHHGSKYSSSDLFLGAVKPAKAYIEVGKNNYGHPTQEALGRLLNSGAKVFRTDLDGTQEFCVAGAMEEVELPAQ